MPPEPATRAPAEALAYWKAKAALTPAEFAELSQQARARAFAVAGLARRDQVAEVHAALTQALTKGEPLAGFKKRLRPLLEAKGWTGKKAWRIENIYRTNMQQAYQAGRYAQLKAAAPGRPYWRYVAVKDSRTRPTHRALDGKVFPHDHEFWSTWYPPNGFMCRCTVQSLSQRQVEARGLEVGERLPRMIEPVDPATGNKMPAVPLRPDPGWAGNCGRDWLEGLAPSELDGHLRDLTSVALCRNGGLCAPPLANLDPRHFLPVRPGDIMAKGLADEDYVRAFLREFGVQDIAGSTVHKLPGGIGVPINKWLFIDKSSGKWKVRKNGREIYVRLLARTIKDPFEVWLVPTRISGRHLDVIRLLRLFQSNSGQVGGFVVWNLTPRGWQTATAFTPAPGDQAKMISYLERQRQGVLLFREP